MVRGRSKEPEDEEGKARRKLQKATLKLEVAQAKQTQARRKGKQEVEQAKLRAAAREAKASQRVERRAAAVTRAQARLHAITSGEAADSPEREEPAPSPGIQPDMDSGSARPVTAAE